MLIRHFLTCDVLAKRFSINESDGFGQTSIIDRFTSAANIAVVLTRSAASGVNTTRPRGASPAGVNVSAEEPLSMTELTAFAEYADNTRLKNVGMSE